HLKRPARGRRAHQRRGDVRRASAVVGVHQRDEPRERAGAIEIKLGRVVGVVGARVIRSENVGGGAGDGRPFVRAQSALVNRFDLNVSAGGIGLDPAGGQVPTGRGQRNGQEE